MTLSRQEIKEELKSRSDKIKAKVEEIFGDHSKDIDFSYIDLFTVLYYSEMKHQAQDPGWAGRDRLVISNLKVMPSALALLADTGYISWKEFNDLVVKLPRFFSNSNISLVKYPGVDFITDLPYLGMIQSLGYSLVGERNRQKYRVYHILNERRSPSFQETLLTAAESKMDNFTAIIPRLDLHKRPSTLHFWFSMGWSIEESKSDDIGSIFESFSRASKVSGRPQMILG